MVYLTCAVIRLCGFRWRKKYKENLEITCNHYGSCCNWNLKLRNVFVPLNFFKACIGESVNLKLWQVKDIIETITKIGLLWFAIISLPRCRALSILSRQTEPVHTSQKLKIRHISRRCKMFVSHNLKWTFRSTGCTRPNAKWPVNPANAEMRICGSRQIWQQSETKAYSKKQRCCLCLELLLDKYIQLNGPTVTVCFSLNWNAVPRTIAFGK